MAQIIDATPCCGGFRSIVDLGRVPVGLALFLFILVELTRALAPLFRLQWRRMASLVLASFAVPALTLALTGPLVFDVDYWRVRWEAQKLEAQIRAKAATDAVVFDQVYARDVAGGFVTAPLTFKRIVYDSSDEIGLEGTAHSADWKGRNARFFICEGHQGEVPRGRHVFGHFYEIYDGR